MLGWLNQFWVLLATILFIYLIWREFGHLIRSALFHQAWKEIKKDKLVFLIIILLGLQIFINFLGAISPELSFDALWYHLTPPKLYVQEQQIFHLPGWLLSVSSLPRLVEMLYTAALTFGNEIWAKLIHFLFGLGCLWALLNLLKRYFSLRISLLGVLTFYTMLIVGWLSTTAYVDLAWTFFEILALDSFLRWYEERKEDYLHQAAILIGLALATKILAFASLFVYLLLIFILRRKDWFKKVLKFGFLSLLVISPWLILSWVNVGNPLFPFFGSPVDARAINVSPSSSWLITKLTSFPFLLWRATFEPGDIISPVYLLFLPLVLCVLWKQKKSFRIVGLYCLLGSFLVPVESGRYLLPYLAGFSLPLLTIFTYPWQKKLLNKVFIIVIIFSCLLNLGGRGLATKKFLPYLLGRETKTEFLTKNLNFSFGDFYDVDGFLKENILPQDLVLVYGIHNLYYLDFPYVHESWVKPGIYFTHILVAGRETLPQKFGPLVLQYQNPKTGVRLYLFGREYQ